jgi:hypothetical protein
VESRHSNFRVAPGWMPLVEAQITSADARSTWVLKLTDETSASLPAG